MCEDGMCLLSDPIVAALIAQGGHLPADLHLGAVGVGEVLEVQAGHQLPVNLVLFFNSISSAVGLVNFFWQEPEQELEKYSCL